MPKLTSLIPTLLILAIHAFAFADDPVTPTPVTPTPAEVTPTPIPPRPFIPITFPLLPTSEVAPLPTPAPVDPEAVPKLAYGQIYVVQSDSDFALRDTPKKLVTITKSPGPITVRGTFADGSGKVETRIFNAKYVAFVDANENATGRITLTAIPYGFTNDSEITDQLIDIGAGPRPPPIPIPAPPIPPGPTPDPNPPTPTPPVPPAPTGFRVLFIYNTAANLSREQYNILYSTKIVDYLNTHCVKAQVNGRDLPEWRKWSPNVKIMPTESRTMADLWDSIDHAKIADKLPQIVIAVNGAATTYQITTAETEQTILNKLKAVGGE